MVPRQSFKALSIEEFHDKCEGENLEAQYL